MVENGVFLVFLKVGVPENRGGGPKTGPKGSKWVKKGSKQGPEGQNEGGVPQKHPKTGPKVSESPFSHDIFWPTNTILSGGQKHEKTAFWPLFCHFWKFLTDLTFSHILYYFIIYFYFLLNIHIIYVYFNYKVALKRPPFMRISTNLKNSLFKAYLLQIL
jgi:hypothetical protein